MQDRLAERRKQRLHEEWLNRAAYVHYFPPQEPPLALPNWKGNPDKCGCGCGEVRYSRANPANWWEFLSPGLLWNTRFLLPLFRDLYIFLWHLWAPVWLNFRAVFSMQAVKDHVIAAQLTNKLVRAFMPVRFLFWLVLSLLLFTVAAAAWSLPRIGGIVIIPLYFAAMMLLTVFMGLVMGLATVFIASYGLVFLIGGAASILYGLSPVFGIVLIVAGVGLEYENRRRLDRENREQIGRVLRIIMEKAGNNPQGRK